MIRLRRVYDKTSLAKVDFIVLVDRLWPRGIKKEDRPFDVWLKDVAPSDELRKWFEHEDSKWPEFKKRYFKELDDHKQELQEVFGRKKSKKIIFLYAAKNEEHNNAVALKEYIEKKIWKK